jgi:hypothetical protein
MKRSYLFFVVFLFTVRVFPQDSPAPANKTGVYVGIISFDTELHYLTPRDSPILLDTDGLEQFNKILDTGYKRATRDGTLLFYGVHQTLADLTANAKKYPNLDSVYLLTFTDGLDNRSTGRTLSPIEGQDFRGKKTSDYQGYVKGQIDKRRVAGQKITAFSVGVRGSAQDPAKFKDSLASLASDPAYGVWH